MKLVLATLATLALVLPLSANAEKMELTFEKQPDGKYCGKFYSSKWSDRMTYQCRTKEQWERRGVNFPAEETPVILRNPIIFEDNEILA